MHQQRGDPQFHEIDGHHAHVIANAHLSAARETRDPLVLAAYAELGVQADRWYRYLTGGHARPPVSVVHTHCREPYATGAELAEGVRTDGVLELCPSTIDRDRRHPLLDTSVGGTYDRFRAVHDLVSHARHGLGFDRHGEFSAWLVEDSLYHGLARWALATELHGEHSVRWTSGEPADHRATLLPVELLRSSRRRALRGADGRPPGRDS